jgi:hypothetical protein
MDAVANKIRELLERNNGLIDKKIIMLRDLMTISAYWNGYDPSIAEGALEILREHNRID